MQFSVGVEYALHCLLYMVDLPAGKLIGTRELATFQGVSETYLSKVYTKLRKAGVVKSIPGVNGGYELARAPEDITFWDVVEAIEGASPLFQCSDIRKNNILLDKNNLPDAITKCPCLIRVVMLEAEEQMRSYLQNKTLGWLHEQVYSKLSEEQKQVFQQWFSGNANDDKK